MKINVRCVYNYRYSASANRSCSMSTLHCLSMMEKHGLPSVKKCPASYLMWNSNCFYFSGKRSKVKWVILNVNHYRRIYPLETLFHTKHLSHPAPQLSAFLVLVFFFSSPCQLVGGPNRLLKDPQWKRFLKGHSLFPLEIHSCF